MAMVNPRVTRTQTMAMVAAERTESAKVNSKYRSFARSFPSLIHTSGLSSSIAYAFTKEEFGGVTLLGNLAKVMSALQYRNCESPEQLQATVNAAPMAEYVQMSRDALLAAGYLKRYAEALIEEAADATDN